jgi:hypothetical protein
LTTTTLATRDDGNPGPNKIGSHRELGSAGMLGK